MPEYTSAIAFACEAIALPKTTPTLGQCDQFVVNIDAATITQNSLLLSAPPDELVDKIRKALAKLSKLSSADPITISQKRLQERSLLACPLNRDFASFGWEFQGRSHSQSDKIQTGTLVISPPPTLFVGEKSCPFVAAVREVVTRDRLLRDATLTCRLYLPYCYSSFLAVSRIL